mmetsp:Transcript_24048/g.40943  ORF Transcript_24048/g.40943 Transcript_24048/m.40943 type:complete len:865 (-) Transcript_24048:292-2886(-)
MHSIEMNSAAQQQTAPTPIARRLAVLVLLTINALLLPKNASAFQTSTPKQHRRFNAAVHYGNDKVSIGSNDIMSHLLLQPRRLSSSTTTSTSLHFFGKKQEEEQDKELDVISNDDDDDDDNKNIFSKAWPTLKIALPSFLVGGIATLCVLFLPLLADYYEAFHSFNTPSDIYNTDSTSKTAASNGKLNNNINQPVILFETILNDLNDAYVDDVDIQKLFETGVKAMTASLDPYTEFESRTEAAELEESVTGRYGGVGLVIRGGTNLAEAAKEDGIVLEQPVDSAASPLSGGNDSSNNRKQQPRNALKPPVASSKDADEDEEDIEITERKRARRKSMEDGVRVVSAFEGYAYDAGMRVGDKLLAIDDFDILPTTSPDEVRNHLRGDPGTEVQVKFLREGEGGKVNEPQTITLKRAVVHIPDVKYFGYVGDPRDGIGYIDLSGFANDAGREVRFAIKALQHGSELMAMKDGDAPKPNEDGLFVHDPTKLKGLVLDLRSNPGGLLTSAVDVATLFVPNGSDIVSAKGRGFPEILYRSKTDPILSPNTRLAVLVNDQTASAAEIVSGAIQDLDVGVVVGKGRTYGKGLVQNVQDLPYQTALKYTVAKYYTPSGRCIQSTVYEEGGRGDDLLTSTSEEKGGPKFKSKKVADKDRTVFYTAHGREVKDGGGVEVDYKVEPQKASPLEIILLSSGTYSDYAAEWSKTHELTDQFSVDESTYKDFQRFVEQKQADGDLKLEVFYDSQLKELSKKLKASKFDSSKRMLESLRADIIKDVKKDFKTYKTEIIEDLEQNILARYLPDSMLIERGLQSDIQVLETAKMLKDGNEFDSLLARDQKSVEKGLLSNAVGDSSIDTASSVTPEPKLQTRW